MKFISFCKQKELVFTFFQTLKPILFHPEVKEDAILRTGLCVVLITLVYEIRFNNYWRNTFLYKLRNMWYDNTRFLISSSINQSCTVLKKQTIGKFSMQENKKNSIEVLVCSQNWSISVALFLSIYSEEVKSLYYIIAWKLGLL